MPDDVPVGKWLQLFDVKAAASGWAHNDEVANLSEYVEDEAFRWYLENLLGIEET